MVSGVNSIIYISDFSELLPEGYATDDDANETDHTNDQNCHCNFNENVCGSPVVDDFIAEGFW